MKLNERIKYLSQVELEEPCLKMLVKARTAYVQGNEELASLLVTLIEREYKRQQASITFDDSKGKLSNKFGFFKKLFHKGSMIDKTI